MSSPRSYVHRPSRVWVLYASMAFVGVVSLPAYVVAPSRATEAGGAFGLAVLLVFEMALLSIARRHVVLSVDETGTRLTIRDVRWPFADRTDVVNLAEVRGLKIQKAPRSTAVRIVLVLRSGETRPLTRSYFAGGAHMDREISAIGAACGLRAAE